MTKFKETAKKVFEKKTVFSINSRNSIIIDEDFKSFRKAMASNDANCNRTINNNHAGLERLNVIFESSLWFIQIAKLMLFTWLNKMESNQGIMNKCERSKINAIRDRNGLNLPIHAKVMKMAEKKNSTTDEEKNKLNNGISDKYVKQRIRGNNSNVLLDRQNRFTDNTNSTLWFYQIVKRCKVLPKRNEQDMMALNVKIEIINNKTLKSFTQTKMMKEEENNLTETEVFEIEKVCVGTKVYY